MTNKNEMKRVLLAAPSYDGRYDVRFMDSLINTISLCEKNNITVLPYFLCYDSLIQRVRNDYFKVAYQSGVDVLFFIDSDIGWKAEDFVKLVLSDKDMIGGTYRKKTDNEELYAFKALGDNNDTFSITPEQNGLLEVNGLGCGFLKISKNCVKSLFENEPNFYINEKENSDVQEVVKNICDCTINSSNRFVSEDITLGFKWKNLGGKVYLDTNIALTHVGIKEYTGNVQTWLANWEVKLRNQKQITETKNEILSKYFVSPLPNPELQPIDNQSVEQYSYDPNVFKVL